MGLWFMVYGLFPFQGVGFSVSDFRLRVYGQVFRGRGLVFKNEVLGIWHLLLVRNLSFGVQDCMVQPSWLVFRFEFYG